MVASQTLRAALTKAEQAHPGLSYDIVMGILKKGDLNVNLNESILRLQGNAFMKSFLLLKIYIKLMAHHRILIILFPFFVFLSKGNATETDCKFFEHLNK